jgi:hypothetical protein
MVVVVGVAFARATAAGTSTSAATSVSRREGIRGIRRK